MGSKGKVERQNGGNRKRIERERAGENRGKVRNRERIRRMGSGWE